MAWNWELPEWPHFKYEPNSIALQEKQFLLGVGKTAAYLKNIPKKDYDQFVVDILTTEGIKSSRIEGELLDRESLQSSIKKHFGLNARGKESEKEARMAKLLCDVYKTYDKALNHEMLCSWHCNLFAGQTDIEYGKYRTHSEPMQIISSRYGSKKVFFEAPPSVNLKKEMTTFINWFNTTRNLGSALARAAIAHVYFESIHPFEDENGRIGRAVIEKVLSQELDQPVLIAVSKVLEGRRKEYYAALERCNRTLNVGHWVEFFAEAVLQAQKESVNLLYFLIEKSKKLTELEGQINSRQEQALLRMFAEGPSGFQGGLSAENYIAITKISRASATRDLADLVEKGVLTKTGELRHTRYWLNIPKEFSI